MNDLSYNKWSSKSDSALERSFGEYIKHHRLKQNITQGKLSKNAGISRSTLSLMERGESVNISTFIKVLRALNLLHIMENFEVQNEISPIQLAKLEREQRKRASASK